MRGFPQPREGWRAFAGEVGVIVLGVLLALGAQQMAEAIQMRRDVTAFRQTINTEIAKNLWVYRYRLQQVACVERELDELDRWIALAGNGRPVVLDRIPFAYTFSLYRSAWDTRNPDVFAALPSADRAKYAVFYDELENNVRLADVELKSARTLTPYRFKGALSLTDLRAIWTSRSELRTGNRSITGNYQASFDIARALGVTAAVKPEGMDGFLKDASPCVFKVGS